MTMGDVQCYCEHPIELCTDECECQQPVAQGDPPCPRCGGTRTVGGYGTDELFPCPECVAQGDPKPSGGINVLQAIADELANRKARAEAAEAELAALQKYAKADHDTMQSLLDDAEAQLAQAREALRETYGIAQSMADMDSWIAEQAGMVRGDEVGEWVVPSAVAILQQGDKDA